MRPLAFDRRGSGILMISQSFPVNIELTRFLEALKVTATSPLALIAYLALLVAWVYVLTANRRLKIIARSLKDIPEADRLKILIQEYRTTPRVGLTAEQWIRSRKHQFFFLGVIATLVGAVVIILAAMSRPVKATGEMLELKRHVEKTAELDAGIEYLNVVLGFRGPVRADAVKDCGILVRLTKVVGVRHSILEVLADATKSENDRGDATWGFSFEALSIVADYQTRKGATCYMPIAWESSLPELPLPLSVGASPAVPFSKIRDLNDCYLQVFLPIDLAEAVQRIDLVANSSTGFKRRFQVFSRVVSKDEWIQVDIDVMTVSGKRVQRKMWTPTEGRGPWTVDSQESGWQERSSSVSDVFRVLYH